MFRKQFVDIQDACVLAQAIVDTVREPLIVLDQELRVIAASRSFYLKFGLAPGITEGTFLHELGDGEWDIPMLRMLLGKIVPEHGTMEDFEVEHEFSSLGHRTLCLNARKVFYDVGLHTNILLSIEDITGRRAADRAKDELLRQNGMLLEESRHRVGNSLQIVAAIILLKANSVDSEDTRRHLHDTHKRVMSVAAVHEHLYATAASGPVELMPYLEKLCEALSHSMIGDNRTISLTARGDGGSATRRDAESLGLIVTELVINAVKHGFGEDIRDGKITVSYDVSGRDWKLTVADNGVGLPDGVFAQPKAGLGTGIVKALAKQLDAQVLTVISSEGSTVTVTHAKFAKRVRAA
jgi:chemotaxis protein methyltransferase CheR